MSPNIADFLNDFVQIEINQFQHHFPGLDFREIQNVIEQIEQGLTRGLNCLGLNALLIPRYGGDGAAFALLGTLSVAVAVAMIWAGRFYGVPVQLATLLRVTVATLLVCALSLFWDVSGFTILIKLTCLVILYAGTLWLLREFGPSDLQAMAFWKKS